MRSTGNGGSHVYGFGPFVLDGAERTLLHAGRAVHLTPKVLDTLLILVERRGQLVRKDELMEALWPDSYVEERNLTQNIFLLRKALGGGGPGRQYIYTVPKAGYRFTGDVQEILRPLVDEGQGGRPEATGEADDSAGAPLQPTPAAGGGPFSQLRPGARFAVREWLARHGLRLNSYLLFLILLILGAAAWAFGGTLFSRILAEAPAPPPAGIGPAAAPPRRGVSLPSGGWRAGRLGPGLPGPAERSDWLGVWSSDGDS